MGNQTWNDPDEDIFYSDESVRWTVRELRAMKLAGKPLRVMHQDELPAVGTITDNWVDKDGDLHITAEISGKGRYGQLAIDFVDSGACHELSVGYPLRRNPHTKEVHRLDIDEVSIVNEAHFRGCQVNVKAGRSASGTKLPTEAPYTMFRVVRAGGFKFDAPQGRLDFQISIKLLCCGA